MMDVGHSQASDACDVGLCHFDGAGDCYFESENWMKQEQAKAKKFDLSKQVGC